MSKETDQHTDRDYMGWVAKLDQKSLPEKDAKFIGDLKESKVSRFSERQREWILDLLEKYL